MTNSRRATIKRLIGVALLMFSLVTTIWLGIRGSSDAPLGRSESVALVVITALFQVAGGLVISQSGKADPSLARSAVRRLLRIAGQTNEMRRQVEAAFDTQTQAKNREILGIVSIHLSNIEEAAVDSIDDWMEFHHDELHKLVSSSQQNQKEK